MLSSFFNGVKNSLRVIVSIHRHIIIGVVFHNSSWLSGVRHCDKFGSNFSSKIIVKPLHNVVQYSHNFHYLFKNYLITIRMVCDVIGHTLHHDTYIKPRRSWSFQCKNRMNLGPTLSHRYTRKLYTMVKASIWEVSNFEIRHEHWLCLLWFIVVFLSLFKRIQCKYFRSGHEGFLPQRSNPVTPYHSTFNSPS
jgi:hypothetical protein